jgi:hypothetical protein
MKPQDRLVTLRLPLELIQQIERLSRAQDQSPAETIRSALETGLGRAEPGAPTPLRAVLNSAISAAGGWLDLQVRLRRDGFVLRMHEEGRLALHDWPVDHFVLWLDTLGHDYAGLCLRYHAPFPGAVRKAPPVPFKSHRTPERAA